MKDTKFFITVYTRTTEPDSYPAGLANSVHFGCSTDGTNSLTFNKNYGILFAKAEINADNTILPKGVCNPKIFHMQDDKIGICAERIEENGDEDLSCRGQVLLWETSDLIHFTEKGFISISELEQWNPTDCLSVNNRIAQEAITYWNPIVNTGVSVPESVEITDISELQSIYATVLYSDGSTDKKKIIWDLNSIDKFSAGTYKVKGTIAHASYKFPLTKGYGDPVILNWEGKWYFIATNDNLNDIGLYVRVSENISGLFQEGIEEHLILPFDKERGFEQTFWAPEFHIIGGELYILFAVSGEMWGPQCHVMKLKKGGNIICEQDWENPIPVCRKDGSPLAPSAISLDMTYINAQNGSYMVWSYRKGIGTPLDTGSMIYIASIDEEKPWILTSEPVLLTRPLYGWENVSGTINNEGPYAFVKNGKVYLTYSGGAADSYTYALGLLTANTESDLLDIGSWEKSITPVLTFYSVEGEYGPGHNSFFTNEYGELMIAYHAETDIKSRLRCDGIRKVHFRKDGSPYFQMSSEEDLNEENVNVEIEVVIK